jgi:hypothetical protein
MNPLPQEGAAGGFARDHFRFAAIAAKLDLFTMSASPLFLS